MSTRHNSKSFMYYHHGGILGDTIHLYNVFESRISLLCYLQMGAHKYQYIIYTYMCTYIYIYACKYHYKCLQYIYTVYNIYIYINMYQWHPISSHPKKSSCSRSTVAGGWMIARTWELSTLQGRANSNYTAENKHDIGKSSFSIGKTYIFKWWMFYCHLSVFFLGWGVGGYQLRWLLRFGPIETYDTL